MAGNGAITHWTCRIWLAIGPVPSYDDVVIRNEDEDADSFYAREPFGARLRYDTVRHDIAAATASLTLEVPTEARDSGDGQD